MNKESYIADIKCYIKESKAELISFATAIGWQSDSGLCQNTSNGLNETDEIYDSIIENIKEKARNAEKSMKNMRPAINELPDPIPKCFLGHEKMAVTISEDAKLELLKATRTRETLPPPPVTSDDYYTNYTPEERNILYKYAISNCVKIQSPPELVLEDTTEADTSNNSLTKENEELLRLEKLKQERDLKRRRQAYRRKVSTKDKSQAEVTREMIGNIMEALGYTTDHNTVKLGVDVQGCKNSNPDTKNQLGVWVTPPEDFDRYRFSRKFDTNKSRQYSDIKNNFKNDYHSRSSKEYRHKKISSISSKHNSGTSNLTSKEDTFRERRENNISKRDSERPYRDSEKRHRSEYPDSRKDYTRHEKHKSRYDRDKNIHSTSNSDKSYHLHTEKSSSEKYEH